MTRARSARLRRVVAARTHAVSCARSCAATANLVATAMPCLHHAITGMASELTRRDTSMSLGLHDYATPTNARAIEARWFALPAAIKDKFSRIEAGKEIVHTALH